MQYLMADTPSVPRRACLVVRATRSSVYYRSRKDPLTALRQRMRELAQTRARFGYRRLRVLLLREGGRWDHATAVHREQRRPATARNDIWSMESWSTNWPTADGSAR